MRIFRNLRQALGGVALNKGNTFLMTLGIIVGIGSLTVIVAIGEGTKAKVLDRIANLGFGPESFSVYAGPGRLFFARSGATTSLTLEDVDDIRALPTVRLVIPRQRKRIRIIYKKEFTTTRVYGVTPEWQTARNWDSDRRSLLHRSAYGKETAGDRPRVHSGKKNIWRYRTPSGRWSGWAMFFFR